MKQSYSTNSILLGTFFVTLAIFFIGFQCGKQECKEVIKTVYVTVTTEAPTEVETTKATEPTTIETTTEKQKQRKLYVSATAYCACEKCCGTSDGITATGTKATAGRTIAVDPSVIPYGTRVIINGHTYIAEDCGGAVNGNEIDIFFDNHEEALNFGRQQLTAYIE